MRMRLRTVGLSGATVLLSALLALAATATPGVVQAVDNTAKNEEQAQQRLAELLGSTSEQLNRLQAEASGLQGRAQELEARLVLDFSRVGPSRAMFLPSPPAGQVTVQLLAEPVDAAIPGRFEFYLASPEQSQLFKTESLPRGQTMPTGQKLADGIVFVEPGKLYMLQVVYRNPTDKDIRFLAGAPTLDPQAALPYARARCWCAAIPFTAPAGGIFSRTIQVGVAPNTPPGTKAIVIWPVVALK